MQPVDSSQRLMAYYNKIPSTLLLAGGIAGTAYYLWSATQIGNSLSPLTGLAVGFFGLGCYCLQRPYFLLESQRLTVYNLLGMEKKRYTFESWDVVKADSRRIYIDDNGITKKVPVTPWLVKGDDWAVMRSLL
ncbi:hypothetical protein [cf. Phormidesmis sp. LEGE 11477]|uniref:hypothetical protein n=1 Tax=cf. Phormidesmis sp. LEGE 11477 TaxID=1828680 RepID=UPI00187F3BA5|nr:hypothetical protein [cf. Phormidesmis sp. LEGE 11477]MBE9060875.1 hypothetical protein [cf. Phormidesmis sp. LEGE 11477]